MNSTGVIIVGSLNVDLSFFTDNFPKPTETIFGNNFIMGYGGKGANQFMTCSFLGSVASIIGKVGDDLFGNMYIKYLIDQDLKIDGIEKTKSSHTGAACITINSHGDNEIIVVPGANMLLSDSDILTRKHLISTHRVLVCQFEVNMSATSTALKLGSTLGLVTILNPSPIHTPQEGKSAINCSQLCEMLMHSDIVCPNESEAFVLLNCGLANNYSTVDLCIETDNKLIHELVPCLLLMSNHGVKWPIITLGSIGAITLLSEEDNFSSDVKLIGKLLLNDVYKKILHIQAPQIKDVVDTSGAGDCFIGALAYFVANHKEIGIIEKIRRSVWIASQSVRKTGTQLSYPKRQELPEILFLSERFQWPFDK